MGDDEVIVMIVSGIGALAMWGIWGLATSGMSDAYYRNGHLKKASALGGLGIAVALFLILKLWASFDVRDDVGYLTQYWLMGAFVAGFAGTVLSHIMGVSYRHDVCENRNPAAAFAWLGVVMGFTLAYAGSNIGDGPGWWVVVFCSAISCGFLWLIWFLLELLCHVSERITVERDIGAGMRFGGLMVGMGIVAGRGAAGDWLGSANAIEDFVSVVLPALPLVVCAVVVELLLSPRPGASWRDVSLLGLIPGALFLAGGLFYVVLLKPW